MAFGLIACLKLASMLLPTKHLALASSLIVTIGMIGGVFSNLVLQALIDHLGYRWSLIIVAIFGIFVALVIWFFIHLPKQGMKKTHAKGSIWSNLGVVVREKQNWLCGFFTCLLNLPLVVLGALFGISYLQQVYGFSNLEAASITSMLFIGMIFGSPFFGWLSDFVKQRRLPMAIGGVLCLLFVLLLMYFVNLHMPELYILLFAIGFTSAAQVLSYPMITQSNSLKFTATALAIASIIIIGIGYGVTLPMVGGILEWGWMGKYYKGAHDYALSTYRNAFLTMPIGIAISLILIAFMREPKGKQYK
jgi:MFS family permease